MMAKGANKVPYDQVLAPPLTTHLNNFVLVAGEVLGVDASAAREEGGQAQSMVVRPREDQGREALV